MDLADKIRQKREEKRMSQAEVARALELDPAGYFRLEKRGKKLSIEQVEQIAKVIGVPLMELLSETEESNEKVNEEISLLHRRIAELEERLKDKQTIVDGFYRSHTRILEQIEFSVLRVGAEDLHLGKPNDLKEAIELYKADPDPQNILLLYPTKLSQNDYIKTIFHIYQTDHKFFVLVARLIEEGIIDGKKPFIKPFVVMKRMHWPEGVIMPTYVKEAMDELGLTPTDIATMARIANVTELPW